MNFLNHILKVLDINEEIEEIIPTEEITFKRMAKPKIFDNFLDFQLITKSGKILIFEFKKRPITTKDLKQAYDYYMNVTCKQKADVKLILIVLTDKGKITEYTKLDVTYHPQIIKTKKINKQKDLSIIRQKLHNNKKITIPECSLLITLPLFKINTDEEKITKEICNYLKFKKHCLCNEIIDEMTLAMHLNIIEYIPEDEQEELLEMINMAEKYQGVIAQIRNEGFEEGKNKGFEDGRNEGFEEGERNIINELLKNFSVDTVCKLTHKNKNEINKLIKENS